MTTGDAPRLAAVTGETVKDHMREVHGWSDRWATEVTLAGWLLLHDHNHKVPMPHTHDATTRREGSEG